MGLEILSQALSTQQVFERMSDTVNYRLRIGSCSPFSARTFRSHYYCHLVFIPNQAFLGVFKLPFAPSSSSSSSLNLPPFFPLPLPLLLLLPFPFPLDGKALPESAPTPTKGPKSVSSGLTGHERITSETIVRIHADAQGGVSARRQA